MPETSKVGRTIRDFPGLALGTDVHDLPEGTTDLQTNCTSEDRGVLRSRNGYTVLTFEGE